MALLKGALSAGFQFLLDARVQEFVDCDVSSVRSAAQHIGIMTSAPMSKHTLCHCGECAAMPAQTATTATQSSTNASSSRRGRGERVPEIAGGGHFGMLVLPVLG
jgi:hypothetical protein